MCSVAGLPPHPGVQVCPHPALRPHQPVHRQNRLQGNLLTEDFIGHIFILEESILDSIFMPS